MMKAAPEEDTHASAARPARRQRGPGGRRADRGRGAAPVREDPADPVGELRLRGGARGLGHGADQQVLGRVSGAPVLRGPAVHRPDRDPGGRAGRGAVRRRPRQRAAVLGFAGQPRRVPRLHGAGRDLALLERPKLIFCGGTAIPRTIDFPAFAEIAAEAGAVLVADIAHIAGLVARGAHPSPVGHAGVITTTTHKTLRGPRGAMIMTTAEHASRVDKAVFPGLQRGPHNHTTAAIAVPLPEPPPPPFRTYVPHLVSNAPPRPA